MAAAERLHVHLDGLEIPIDLEQLEAWSRRRPRRPDSQLVSGDDLSEGELAVWLELMDGRSRNNLSRLLRAPLLRSRTFGEQLLTSWAGQRILVEVGGLLTDAQGRGSSALLQESLRRLLEERGEVTVLDLLDALPTDDLHLQLDTLLTQAEQWRDQLRLQQRALGRLRRMELPDRQERPLAFSDAPEVQMQPLLLPVAHRDDPLPLELWRGRSTAAPAGPWVLLMPGLGGNSEQLGWLAAALADRGWPAVVLQHPGSDAGAMRALLAGSQPPPGAETLPDRLADLEAVLAAEAHGPLPPLGDGVVLMGHSLGAMTALLASGPAPEPGLERRCREALRRLPITNLSRLLQCQMADLSLELHPPPSLRERPLRGVVVFNGFGSLLWPGRGLENLSVPLLMVGGSLDLITPPVNEQLALFLPSSQPRSRLVVVDGGSHFSPVRVSRRGEALFQLGEELVGVEPQRVQNLILRLSVEFLQGLNGPDLLPPQHRLQEGIGAYVLDAAAARHWQQDLNR
ncbi:alpha/beta hydrolase [Synechococcus sp. CCY9202]|uniref:alpha/beta hydrolase n=1 Tax=Synechococcus sp. CCY9202 TaxID=174698 RepID=UPI002B1FDB6F|nr:alpha/beta fold hydrolase [Synechococcus sp. CCY9202]MEA5421932.1 alpha/beta fold hydrolase [Synechococcus sp. CCY9202]